MGLARRGREARSDSTVTPGSTDLGTEIIDHITWYMRHHGITRSRLAEAMGVSPGRISQILSGDENITLKTLNTVIVALGAQAEFRLLPQAEQTPAVPTTGRDAPGPKGGTPTEETACLPSAPFGSVR